MTAPEFADWMWRMRFKPRQAADALGLSYFTILNYLRGKRSGSDAVAAIPRIVELACERLEIGKLFPHIALTPPAAVIVGAYVEASHMAGP